MKNLTYQYETSTPKFTTFEDGKPRGGFVGTHAIKQLIGHLNYLNLCQITHALGSTSCCTF
jgi:hypothetical protein